MDTNFNTYHSCDSCYGANNTCICNQNQGYDKAQDSNLLIWDANSSKSQEIF